MVFWNAVLFLVLAELTGDHWVLNNKKPEEKDDFELECDALESGHARNLSLVVVETLQEELRQ